jgi:hypothetical protein
MEGVAGLAKKLGIVEGSRVCAIRAPEEYPRWLEPLPFGVEFAAEVSKLVDIVHLFSASKAELLADLVALRRSIRPNGVIWVSWPKKASKVATDIAEDSIRELALPLGFVDVKVCAVSEVWSGLKLVIRRELR